MDGNISNTIKAKKEFGQNFLTDIHIASLLANTAEIGSEDTVLEIGPGTGQVTEQLARKAKRVIAIELDFSLIPNLRNKFRNTIKVEIINDDIINYLRYHNRARDIIANKIVGSIPFQITSPLLHQIINCRWWKTASLLIQKEVAEKIIAKPPKANYLSNFVQYFADVKLVANVERGSFFPVPGVDGAIIRLEPSLNSINKVIDPIKWSHFLHRGFSRPRQMINKTFPTEDLTAGEIDSRRRPATLSIVEWEKLYKICFP